MLELKRQIYKIDYFANTAKMDIILLEYTRSMNRMNTNTRMETYTYCDVAETLHLWLSVGFKATYALVILSGEKRIP